MKREEVPASAVLSTLGLEAPLCRGSQLAMDEWTVRRMWETIQRRSEGQAHRRLGRARLSWRLGLALGLIAMGWIAVTWLPRKTVFQGPLVTREGKRFESVEAPAAGDSARIGFADGSQIEAAPGARVEGLAATPSEFVLLLRRGRAHFSVTPGGPRRWLIETRGASVEVVGTRLSVESGAGFVAVRVESGVVLVRSPLLADGVQRVGAGQALRLDTGRPPEDSEFAAPLVGHGTEDPPAPAEPEPALRAGAAEGSDTLHAVAAPGSVRTNDGADAPGSNAHAPESAAATKRGELRAHHTATRAHTRAAELWSGADRARRAGDASRAAELLERLLEQHPGDSQAALGAYTLGVLQLEQLTRPRAAARRFRQALELGIAAGLRESCYVRWAEALRQAGDVPALQGVARDYLRTFPIGEQRDTMQRLLEQSAASESEHPAGGDPK